MTGGMKIAGLIGLAARAGKAWGGVSAVEAAVKRGEARLLLISSDAGAAVTRKTAYISGQNGLPVMKAALSSAEMGGAMGKSGCAVCAVGEKNIADEIIRKIAGERL